MSIHRRLRRLVAIGLWTTVVPATVAPGRLEGGWTGEPRAGAIASEDDAHWWDGFGTASQAGVSYDVHAMTLFQGRLVAGGYFTTAGGVPVDRIAQWDGTSWSPLGHGVDDFDCPEIECLGRVDALTVYDSNLVVGGNFESVDGGLPARYIASWDGTTWRSLGLGVNNDVSALTLYRGDLIAAGKFTEAGGRPANHIARWDGVQWHALGAGLNTGPTRAGLIQFEDELIAMGGFTRAGSTQVSRIARWDGADWHSLGSGISNSGAFCIYDGNLVVGGVMQAGDIEVNGMAQWDGSVWSSLGPYLFVLTVSACCVYNDDLVIGGGFNRPFGNRISRWTGSSWEPMGSGLDEYVFALAPDGNRLYVGGRFLTAGGKPSYRIARWDDVITPVLVQDLQVVPVERGFRLSWRLHSEPADGVLGVHVQRADDPRGPFLNRTSVPLEPGPAMSFEDDALGRAAASWYRLLILQFHGASSIVGPVEASASGGSIEPRIAVISVPGRAGSIQIRYTVKYPGTPVMLGIYDVLGRGVLQLDLGRREQGAHLASWDGRSHAGHLVPSGVYVARLQAGQAAVAKKFVIVR